MDASSGNYNSFLRLLRLPRLYRLIRLVKCARMAPSLKRKCQANDGFRRLGVACAVAVFISHLVTCVWLVFGKMGGSDSWLARKQWEHRSSLFQYLAGFYWTAQTVTTVGFGDIPAKTVPELSLALVWMILGVGFYSYIVGNFSSMMGTLDEKSRTQSRKLEVMEKYAKENKFGKPLKLKIAHHLEEKAKTLSGTMDKILEELPPPLKIEVMNHTKGKVIHGLRFFERKMWNFIWSVLPKLSQLPFLPKEQVYAEGEVASACYFILQGTVEFLTPDGAPFRKFFNRAHFGEFAIIKGIPCQETARTEGYTDLMVLHKSDLYRIFEMFPREAKEITEEAHEKQRVLNHAKNAIIENRRVSMLPPPPPSPYAPSPGRPSTPLMQRTLLIHERLATGSTPLTTEVLET